MVVPCMVKTASYAPGSRKVLRGTASWTRISSASRPPSTKKTAAGQQVQDPDVLVVGGRDPVQEALGARGHGVRIRIRVRQRGHDYLSPSR